MASEIQLWRERWQGDRTGWDLRGPHPYLETILGVASKYWNPSPNDTAINILIPGCGRAHDGAAIVDRKIELPNNFKDKTVNVIATDFAPEAIDAARRLYGHLAQRGMTLLVEDALTDSTMQSGRQFDLVFDRAMLCALRPDDRKRYLTACHRQLHGQGLFLSLPFTKIDNGVGDFSGPPFQIRQQELLDIMTKSGFACLHFETVAAAKYPEIIKEEAITVWKKCQ